MVLKHSTEVIVRITGSNATGVVVRTANVTRDGGVFKVVCQHGIARQVRFSGALEVAQQDAVDWASQDGLTVNVA